MSSDGWAASWPADAPSLTPRQREIVLLVAHGHTNAQIAARLGMTSGGVAVQVGRIMERLRLGTRAEITLWALTRGLVP